MSRGETKKTNIPKELKKRKRELFRASGKMRQAADKSTRKELQRQINELRIDFGWELFDLGHYESGLALYAALPWWIYGEEKCNGMSRALAGLGFYDEARHLLEKGLKRFPESYALWVAMGVLCAELGYDFETLDCFETALRFAPEDDSGALFNKALILTKLGCYADAVSILKDLIGRAPWDARYFKELGRCYLEIGHPEDALREYRKAMKLWQESPTAYEGGCIYMGIYASYRTLGMLKDALAVAQEGLKRFPEEDPGLYQNVADAYYAMGWGKDAISVLKKGIEKFPKDWKLKKVLREIEESSGDPEDGRKPPLLGILLLLTLIRKRFGRGGK